MDARVQPDRAAAITEHGAIVAAHLATGRTVEYANADIVGVA
jgi:hypothetical protein